MDLRNQTITLGELLKNPQAAAILKRNFASLLSHPLASKANKLSLKQIIAMGGSKLPPQVVAQTLAELEAL